MTYCPICHGETKTAENMPGYSDCVRGHRYRNDRALAVHPDDQERWPDWRPIESAPKNTAVLVCDGEFMEIAVLIGDLWLVQWDHSLFDEDGNAPAKFWMPLPPAPEAKP
jgi:hypothetical protein